MNVKALKYLTPLTFYALAWVAFTKQGFYTWLPLVYAWVLIPLLELVITPNQKNLSATEEVLAKKDRLYDYMLYIIVLLQFGALFYFLKSVTQNNLQWWEFAGRVFTMGLLCGTFGINVGHELGHRNNKLEQTLAKALLLSSLYMHFFIEHNNGHHKHVATPQDPSSARLNEPIYLFYFRTFIFSYLSAWKIANGEVRKKNLPLLHWRNEMLQVHFIQIAFTVLVFVYFNWIGVLFFLAAALIGATLLETVNYIEH